MLTNLGHIRYMVRLSLEDGRFLQELGFTYAPFVGQGYWSECWYTEDDEAYDAYRLTLGLPPLFGDAAKKGE